jgi:autoinducer 2-degrading protein
MIVTTVTVFVKPDRIAEFIRATEENHEASLREPGNLRFDVLQAKGDPSRFLLIEAYESEEAAAAHKKTPHYLKWRDAVADWMAKPREGVPHEVLRPEKARSWRCS